MARHQDDGLFDTVGKATTGQVHRSVCASIRAALADHLTDAKLDAGLHAQARSLAAVIDRASGLDGRKQETYALAGLHKELGALMGRIRGVSVADELGDFLKSLAEPEAAPASTG